MSRHDSSLAGRERRTIRRILLIAAVALALALLLPLPWSSSRTVPCRLEYGEYWLVTKDGGGRVATGGSTAAHTLFQFESGDHVQVALAAGIAPGAKVKRGQPVATIVSLRDALALAEAREAIERTHHRIALLERGAIAELVREAEAALDEARRAQDLAMAELGRMRELEKPGLASASELDAHAAAADLAAARVRQETARVAALRAGAPAERVAAERRELARYEQELASAQAKLRSSALVSPFDGDVAAPAAPSELLRIVEPSSLQARAELGRFAGPAQAPGVAARLRFPDLPGRELSGRLIRTEAPASGGFAAIVSLDDAADLRAGLSGFARLEAPATTLRATMLGAIERFFREEVWSWT